MSSCTDEEVLLCQKFLLFALNFLLLEILACYFRVRFIRVYGVLGRGIAPECSDNDDIM